MSTLFRVNGNTIRNFVTGISFSRADAGDAYADIIVQGNGIDHDQSSPTTFGPGVTSVIFPVGVPVDCQP